MPHDVTDGRDSRVCIQIDALLECCDGWSFSMRDALHKLQRLQRELKHLHRTTAEVIEQSQRLIDDLDKGTPAAVPPRPPTQRARRRSPSRRTRP
jgi:hypothetical protein